MENQLLEGQPIKKSKKGLIILGLIIILFAVLVIIVGKDKGGNSENKNMSTFTNSSEDIEKAKASVRKELTYDLVISNPENYEGEIIQWGAKVFTQPSRDEDGVYFQAYEGGDDNNFVVAYGDPNFQVKEDDFVIVTGKVKGELEGENAFGAKLNVPAIKALYIEAGTRNNVVAPADTVVPINDSFTQNKFTVILGKIELSERETRFFIKLKNEGESAVNFYDFNSKLTQGNKQYENESIDNNQELPSEILPGIEAEGVVAFPTIDKEQKQLMLYLDEPSNGNYSLDWEEVKFNITLP